MFQTPVDIGNRAVQHVGGRKIKTFADISVEAKEINTCYDGLRAAELSTNDWRFAIRRARMRALNINTQLFTPSAWGAGTTYTVGGIASYPGTTYANGSNDNWILTVPTSTGDQPDISPKWSHFFGTRSCDIWDSAQTYQSGELVIIPEAYAGGTTYAMGELIASAGIFYYSRVGSNIGHTPASSPTQWAVYTNGNETSTFIAFTYSRHGAGPVVYNSIFNGLNSANVPGTDAHWVACAGTVQTFTLLYPTSSSTGSISRTPNAFYLPDGYLKPAPADPKQDRIPYLGVPLGPMPDDYVYEGNLMFSAVSGPITLRFSADIADVNEMDPLFCEMLAANIGKEICPKVTQSTEKIELCEAAYKKAATQARTSNAIIIGAPAPELDDLITCRF